jgi:5-methylthioadenosine/S-adenosylhomocysteine deaminase
MEKEIGSLDKGKRADFVIVDMDVLNQTPHYSIYSDLVYSSKAADVRTVVIEGRTVMRDGRLITLDEPTVKRNAQAYRQRISASIGR